MTVILNMTDGGTQLFETNNFAIVPEKMANPFIVKIRVFDNKGKKIASWKRKNARAYMKNFVPPVEPEQTEAPVEAEAAIAITAQNPDVGPVEEQTVYVREEEKAEPAPEQTENA